MGRVWKEGGDRNFSDEVLFMIPIDVECPGLRVRHDGSNGVEEGQFEAESPFRKEDMDGISAARDGPPGGLMPFTGIFSRGIENMRERKRRQDGTY